METKLCTHNNVKQLVQKIFISFENPLFVFRFPLSLFFLQKLQIKIDVLHLGPSPEVPSQKLQAGLYAGVIVETL
jgi:hypothetical protein